MLNFFRQYTHYVYAFVILSLLVVLVYVTTRGVEVVHIHEYSHPEYPDSIVYVKMDNSETVRYRNVLYHSDPHCPSLAKATTARISFFNPPEGMHLVPCAKCAKDIQEPAGPEESEPVTTDYSKFSGNIEKIKSLYQQCRQFASDVDCGSELEFIEGMQTDINRAWLYDQLKERGLFDAEMTYGIFCSKLGFIAGEDQWKD